MQFGGDGDDNDDDDDGEMMMMMSQYAEGSKYQYVLFNRTCSEVIILDPFLVPVLSTWPHYSNPLAHPD